MAGNGYAKAVLVTTEWLAEHLDDPVKGLPEEDVELAPIVKRLAAKAAEDERNFVKKAVNWALRQVGKHRVVQRGHREVGGGVVGADPLRGGGAGAVLVARWSADPAGDEPDGGDPPGHRRDAALRGRGAGGSQSHGGRSAPRPRARPARPPPTVGSMRADRVFAGRPAVVGHRGLGRGVVAGHQENSVGSLLAAGVDLS